MVTLNTGHKCLMPCLPSQLCPNGDTVASVAVLLPGQSKVSWEQNSGSLKTHKVRSVPPSSSPLLHIKVSQIFWAWWLKTNAGLGPWCVCHLNWYMGHLVTSCCSLSFRDLWWHWQANCSSVSFTAAGNQLLPARLQPPWEFISCVKTRPCCFSGYNPRGMWLTTIFWKPQNGPHQSPPSWPVFN